MALVNEVDGGADLLKRRNKPTYLPTWLYENVYTERGER